VPHRLRTSPPSQARGREPRGTHREQAPGSLDGTALYLVRCGRRGPTTTPLVLVWAMCELLTSCAPDLNQSTCVPVICPIEDDHVRVPWASDKTYTHTCDCSAYAQGKVVGLRAGVGEDAHAKRGGQRACELFSKLQDKMWSVLAPDLEDRWMKIPRICIQEFQLILNVRYNDKIERTWTALTTRGWQWPTWATLFTQSKYCLPA
jgi:hypothetical protein